VGGLKIVVLAVMEGSYDAVICGRRAGKICGLGLVSSLTMAQRGLKQSSTPVSSKSPNAKLTLLLSIRYPDPAIRVNDTVKVDLATGKVTDFIRFDTGVIAMATGGRNMGRVGVITHRERHDGGFNIVHIKDALDNEFATRESNVFVIGQEKPWISLPKGKGVKLSIAEERDRKRAYQMAG